MLLYVVVGLAHCAKVKAVQPRPCNPYSACPVYTPTSLFPYGYGSSATQRTERRVGQELYAAPFCSPLSAQRRCAKSEGGIEGGNTKKKLIV